MACIIHRGRVLLLWVSTALHEIFDKLELLSPRAAASLQHVFIKCSFCLIPIESTFVCLVTKKVILMTEPMR